jgi:hypothetical protein
MIAPAAAILRAMTPTRTPRRYSAAALAVLICMAALTGCAGNPRPVFEVERVALTQQSDEAVVLDFTLLATNPADVIYPLREVTYTMTIDGRTVFRGVRSAQATLPENGVQRVRLPVPVSRSDAPDLLDRPHAYRISGDVAYVMPGPIAEALYDLGIRRRRVGFSDSGTLDIPAAP